MDQILRTLPIVMSGSSKRIYTLLSKAGFSPCERFKQRCSDSDADFPISAQESKLSYILQEFGQLNCALKHYFSFSFDNQSHLDSIRKDYERVEEESLLLRQVLSQSSSATENPGEPIHVIVQQMLRPAAEVSFFLARNIQRATRH